MAFRRILQGFGKVFFEKNGNYTRPEFVIKEIFLRLLETRIIGQHSDIADFRVKIGDFQVPDERLRGYDF
jgi:hypothetical protein